MLEVTRIALELPRSLRISNRSGPGAACLIICASVDPLQVGRRLELTEGAVTIGRSPESTIFIESETVSRSHARIERRDRGFFLSDCGSVNGTYVQDEPVGQHELRSGDLIKVGPCILKYLAAGDIEAAYHEEIYRLTITDGLTGIANRRAFEDVIQAEVRRAVRYARPLSLVMFDLDHFKKVNDTYGHMAGDQVLKTVASVVRGRVREGDIRPLRRRGVRCPGSRDAESRRRAARRGDPLLRCQHRVPLRGPPDSGDGVVGRRRRGGDLRTPHQLVKAADARLYEAKRGGRNRVVA